jgi:hypothetical protein
MPLDTQTFPITRHWLSVALTEVPRMPDVFAAKNLSVARKRFLAGSKQLAAIKNWLSRAEVLTITRGNAELTEIGRLMAAQDDRADRAWTWWLCHLHLCTSPDAFPYSDFFLLNDAEGLAWRTGEQIVESLTKFATDAGREIEQSTVSTYFEGVDNAFRLGRPLYGLGLMERRESAEGNGKKRFRRALTKPADIVVAYTTTLFQKAFFEGQQTVESRVLLEKGLARSLGLRDADLREALRRITQHAALSQFLQYRQQANLDSVQFLKSGDGALRSIRMQAYNSQDVRWP